jgi:hypothetical protein
MESDEDKVGRIMEHFVSLQNWNQKPDNTKKIEGIFPVILDLDQRLKDAKKTVLEPALRDLVKEIWDLCDTPSFREIRLSAFNWRSASKKAKLIEKESKRQKSKKRVTKISPTKTPPRISLPPKPSHRPRVIQQPEDCERRIRELQMMEKFKRDFKLFIESIPQNTSISFFGSTKKSRRVDNSSSWWRRVPGNPGTRR